MKGILDTSSMDDRICLVTRATSGIVRVTACTLVGQGADLVIAGRDRQKAIDTVLWIKAETGNQAVDYLLADYSDLDQVRAMATAFKERVTSLITLSPVDGADNSIYIASSPDVQGITGRYFVKQAPVETTSITLDRELATRHWSASKRLAILTI